MSNSDKLDLANQLILIFSDHNRVQLDNEIMSKINKLDKTELLTTIEHVDKYGRVIAYDSIKRNTI